MNDSNRLSKSAVWLVGFRPFFIAAIMAACVFPVLWGLVFSGALGASGLSTTPLQWHAHEMLYGFGWAIMSGFLLTASKNWVKIRGMHGYPLMFAVFLWIAERFAFLSGLEGVALFLATSVSFMFVVGYVVHSLIKYRANDSFADNWLFIIALPLFLIPKYLILQPDTFHLGWPMSIGLFRLAFLIMLERTTTQFMKTTFQVSLLRNKILDMTIKLLALICVFEVFLPRTIAMIAILILAGLILVRLALWKPLAGFSNFGVSTMYVGHLAIPVHLILYAFGTTGIMSFVGDVPTHVFALVTMGTIIPAMLIRIAQGHTGRSVLFTKSDRVALAFMWVGSFIRIVAPQFWPAFYLDFVVASSVCWSACFAIVGYRLIPFLLQPRIDGKVH